MPQHAELLLRSGPFFLFSRAPAHNNNWPERSPAVRWRIAPVALRYMAAIPRRPAPSSPGTNRALNLSDLDPKPRTSAPRPRNIARPRSTLLPGPQASVLTSHAPAPPF